MPDPKPTLNQKLYRNIRLIMDKAMNGDAADFSCYQVWASRCNGWSMFWCVAPSHPTTDHPTSPPHCFISLGWRQCVIGFWRNFILRSILHKYLIPFCDAPELLELEDLAHCHE